LPYMDVLWISPDPDDVDTVVVGGPLLNAMRGWEVTGAIARSEDGGRTWTPVATGIGRAWSGARCAANPQLMYAATLYGLLRSDDGGRTWSPSAFAGRHIATTGVGGASCDRVYASVWNEGLYRSDDGGSMFTGPLVDGLMLQPGRLAPSPIVVDPANGLHVLGSTHGGLYRTTDGGETWELIAGLGDLQGRRIVESRSTPGLVRLATWGAGVWERAPGAAGWSRVPRDVLPEDFAFGLAETSAGTQLVGGWSPIWRRAVGDAVFLSGATVSAFDFTEGGAGAIWASTQLEGIQRSDDDGRTWTSANGDLPPWPTGAGGAMIDVRRTLVHPTTGRLVIATYGRGIFFSDDGGVRWTAADPDLDTRFMTCLAGFGTPYAMYACTSDAGIFTSTDGGDEWTLLSDGLLSLDTAGVAHDAVSGRTFAGTTEGLYELGGSTWTAFEPGCLPDPGVGEPVVVTDGAAGRFLVVSVAGYGLFRHPL
ncbi:MAG: hypothetical protein FD127_4028, partial [Acidimicrobiaceae bacterium]